MTLEQEYFTARRWERAPAHGLHTIREGSWRRAIHEEVCIPFHPAYWRIVAAKRSVRPGRAEHAADRFHGKEAIEHPRSRARLPSRIRRAFRQGGRQGQVFRPYRRDGSTLGGRRLSNQTELLSRRILSLRDPSFFEHRQAYMLQPEQ